MAIKLSSSIFTLFHARWSHSKYASYQKANQLGMPFFIIPITDKITVLGIYVAGVPL